MDKTEAIRRDLVGAINAHPLEREEFEARGVKVWDTSELSRDFEVTGFMAPFVVVREKSTGKKGSMMFQDRPRFYFEFNEA